jgi:hypothetical protein
MAAALAAEPHGHAVAAVCTISSLQDRANNQRRLIERGLTFVLALCRISQIPATSLPERIEFFGFVLPNCSFVYRRSAGDGNVPAASKARIANLRRDSARRS